ncbi:8-oxo-dGTP diphosphatase [Pullulanibacillus sp. KACC 23026]|uniref:NUDIX hydrolase n=1 Tax=Pullulanibacillus sp. KACC 23026 TaxID=3028315 RepID=UPI0023AF5AA6|nr:8-oxo-dGTP diphosphatase [Pullulanibacillus sp. KACC 23026]WEG10897.1 8-oxo-dGTP diphosphatase [Pullulanibacillus sp. KACC 23026]
MLKFTICFIKQGNHFLMLNRESPEWMGAWNGVGGKLEENETPIEGILREVKEETHLELQQDLVQYKGKVTWYDVNGTFYGGMYLFLAEIPESMRYATPVKTAEGILDWKSLDWLLHPQNKGVADVKRFFETMIHDAHPYDYRCLYDEDLLVDVEKVKIVEEPFV